MTSKAKLIKENKFKKVVIFLLNSILIFCEESQLETPVLIVCLEGLTVKDIFEEGHGYGIEIYHREDLYPTRKFFVVNKSMQNLWMENLKFFQGNSITQIYEMNDKIGVGKFSVVYSCK